MAYNKVSSQNETICINHAAPRRSIDDHLQCAYDCTADNTMWLQMHRQWRYILIIVAVGVSSAADAMEMFSIGYILGDPSFQNEILQGDLSFGGALVSAILNIGLIIGGIAAGTSEGRVGRKELCLLGLLITSASGFACALAPSLPLFIACRFAAGLGIGPILSSSTPLVTEISPPRQRGFIVSCANSFWTVGLITNAIFAFLIFGVYNLGWRIYLVTATLPSVVGYILILTLVPESPRFLALQGQYEQAASSANKIVNSLGYVGPIIEAIEIENHYPCCTSQQQQAPSALLLREKFRSAMEKIRTIYKRDLRKPTMTIQTLWISASTGGALALWLNTIFHKIQLQNVYFNFILLNCCCIPGNVASAMLTDRIGRNTFFTVSTFTCSIALYGVASFVFSAGGDSNLEDHTTGIIICTGLYYASLTGVYTCLYVMASELFPTNVRSTGVSLCSAFGRVASILAMFLNGALINNPGLLLFIGASIIMAGSTLSFLSPPNEMKSKPVMDKENEYSDDENDDENDGIRMTEQKLMGGGNETNYLSVTT